LLLSSSIFFVSEISMALLPLLLHSSSTVTTEQLALQLSSSTKNFPKTSFHNKSYDTVAAISGEKKTSKREITNASEGKVEDS